MSHMDAFTAQAAHEAGWRAREQEQPRESNPHAVAGIPESGLFHWWDRGWQDSDAEIRMDKEGPDLDGFDYDVFNIINS